MSEAVLRVLDRIEAAKSWPDWPLRGRAGRGVPDWAEHFIHWAFQFTGRQLGHVDAFMEVPIVNSCVNDLIDDISAIPLRVYRGREEMRVEVEPLGRLVEGGGNLADLLRAANGLDTGRQIRGAAVGSLALTGNAYWHMLRFSPEAPPVELRNLPGQLTRPVPGPNRTIAGFEYDRGGQGLYEPLAADAVLHFRRFNPKDEPIGISRLEAVRQSYEAQYYALLWVRDFFKKGGVLSGVWRPQTEQGQSARIKDKRAVIAEMVKNYYGVDKAWQPVIIEGLEFVQVGMKLSEMEIDRQLVMIEAQIIRALGMPPVQVGTKEGGGLSDAGAKVDLTNYWTRTVPAYTTLIDDVINEKLAPAFGAQFYVEHDLRSVLPIQRERLAQAQTHQALTGSRQLETVNQALRAMGLPPSGDPEDDILHNDKPVPGFDEDGFPLEPKGGEEEPAPKPKAKEKLAEDPRLELRRREQFRLGKFREAFLRFHRERFDEQRAAVLGRLDEMFAPIATLSERKRRVHLDAIDWEMLFTPSEEDEAQAQRMFEQLLKQRGLDALKDVAAAAGVALEVEIDVTQGRWAEYVHQQVDRAIRVPDQTTRKLLREALAETLAEGGTLAELRAAVDQVFDMRRGNALTIARTETLSAYNFAALEAWRESGVVARSMWLTSRSGVGGRHSEDPEGRYAASDGGQGLDGQVRVLGDPFDVGGISLMYPGDPSAPPAETCNCFLPSTRVSGAFVAGVKSRYYGPAREIVLQSGARLSLTPNHPVLTPEGMVPAGALRKGDHLVCDRRVVDPFTRAHAHDQQTPTTIEDVFEALRVGFVPVAVHLRPNDLHGDARHVVGEVDVVGPDGALRSHGQTPGLRSSSDLPFVEEAAQLLSLPCDRASHANLESVARSAARRPRGANTRLDCGATVLLEASPLDPMLITYRPDLDAALAEMAGEREAHDSRLVAQVLYRLASAVALDQVVEVRDFDWVGHVYDLQSTTGLMIAGGAIASNCVCALVPEEADQAELRERIGALHHGAPSLNGHAPKNRIAEFFNGGRPAPTHDQPAPRKAAPKAAPDPALAVRAEWRPRPAPAAPAPPQPPKIDVHVHLPAVVEKVKTVEFTRDADGNLTAAKVTEGGE